MSSQGRDAITPPQQLLVSWLSRLYSHRLTTTTGGNLSIMDDDGSLYITPSGGDKAIVPPENIAVRRPGQTEFEGPKPPSMEWPLHTAAYKARPDCGAVLHAHSMTLVAFSLAKPEVLTNLSNGCDSRIPDTRCLLGAWQACGKVAFAPYELPGSQALADRCYEAFQTGAHCVILQNHGVVTVGSNLQQAYDRFVFLEYLARSIVNAVPLGVPKQLPPEILLAAEPAKGRNLLQDEPFSNPAALCSCHRERIIQPEEKTSRVELCKFIQRAYGQNLITSSSGSFSIRIAESCESGPTGGLSFLVTPTGVDRHSLEGTDLCYLSDGLKCHHGDGCNGANNWRGTNGEKKQKTSANSALMYHPLHFRTVGRSDGQILPSRAAVVHAAIYREHPSVNCIMIVQPPHATSYCITGNKFNSAGIPESHIVLHDVRTVPLASVLKDDGEAVARALDPSSGRSTVLVEGYGLVTVGKNLLQTFVQLEVCESMCGVMLTALRRGKTAVLEEKQVEEIDKAFNSH